MSWGGYRISIALWREGDDDVGQGGRLSRPRSRVRLGARGEGEGHTPAPIEHCVTMLIINVRRVWRDDLFGLV
ncbi:hypothetical protein A9798_03835 [Edwardsiella hoshinae]|uniref:Uncharacterized protein n=1 Tax=Edwardsiella hoshinae TaxID=93378 RepID=A0A376DAD9_9GAMM|nr:hypothetical protein A9798_03835 [Edwardsiella hoshinae]STC85430.1 Uncharacterised protein [Edwardsiella hoshinae]